jgi:meso-butanediol dehydrogenase/(S,S)-butanediol dehydrogenase/diacetyl reductase
MSKVIVITGAGVGLGRTLARRFANDGERVVLLGRTQSKVETAAEEIGHGSIGLQCDVGDPASVRAAFHRIAAHHGCVDVLINNAAIFEPFKLVDATDAQIQNAIGANLAGPLLCARAAIPLMRRGSTIINVSSESVEIPLPHLIVYQTTKAGIECFGKKLSQELEPEGIRVSTVRCGQMFEEGKHWDVDMEAAMAFHQAAMAVGLNLRERAISQFTSLESVFRMLIDLPSDLRVEFVDASARHS